MSAQKTADAARPRLDTPLGRAIGHGAAKDGVHHWWMQRVSSIALLPLTPLFVIPFAQTIGGGHAAAAALYADPLQAIVAILFVAVAAWHLAQGLQVVVEDYVHAKGWRTALLLLNTLGCATLAVAGVFAIAKLSLGG